MGLTKPQDVLVCENSDPQSRYISTTREVNTFIIHEGGDCNLDPLVRRTAIKAEAMIPTHNFEEVSMSSRNGYVIGMILCCAVILASCTGAYAADSAPGKDIVDTAVAAGSFATLVKALQAAALVDTLKGAGPFTVFAPNDAAFARLPAGMLENLLKPENKAKLTDILTYHVVPGKVTAAEAIKRKQLETLKGQSLIISQDADIVAVDNAKILKTDIACSNGLIHVIDTPVIPR